MKEKEKSKKEKIEKIQNNIEEEKTDELS